MINQMADTVMQGLLGLYHDERDMAEHAVKSLFNSDAADTEAVLVGVGRWG